MLLDELVETNKEFVINSSSVLWVGVILLEAEVFNVVIHGKATGAMSVVSFDIESNVQIYLPFFSDIIVLFEVISKVMGMVVANRFNTKVINDEDEDDRAPFVAPNTGSGGALVLSVLG